MRKDENGDPCPETLGEYYDFTQAYFGEQMGKDALQFLKEKIAKSPKGRNEPVIAADSQVRALIFSLVKKNL